MFAVANDLRARRIPNVLTLSGLLAGLVLNSMGSVQAPEGVFGHPPGATGFLLSAAGALLGFVSFIPWYVFRVLGAGDVKLMTAVGSFAGPAATVNIALFVLLAGGVLAMARILMVRNSREVLQNTLAALGQLHPGSTNTFNANKTAWRMPYAVAIAGGVAAYAWWSLSGRPPILNF